jgi:hypothetical protein
MKATAVADLHAGRSNSFFVVAAECLLAQSEIGSSALQVEPSTRDTAGNDQPTLRSPRWHARTPCVCSPIYQ